MLENEKDHAMRQSQDLTRTLNELKNELAYTR